eukprot:TRINITY_DN1773_c0_g1_i1.p1 TRINITY_DN1773_c0_g1~~TRINITY_DN1773_c0_g1_i1.p1  ORF type:complete len:385 (+),score=53.55 TRINITY_DN1773_c0_g1_i1:276-1430(+)
MCTFKKQQWSLEKVIFPQLPDLHGRINVAKERYKRYAGDFIKILINLIEEDELFSGFKDFSDDVMKDESWKYLIIFRRILLSVQEHFYTKKESRNLIHEIDHIYEDGESLKKVMNQIEEGLTSEAIWDRWKEKGEFDARVANPYNQRYLRWRSLLCAFGGGFGDELLENYVFDASDRELAREAMTRITFNDDFFSDIPASVANVEPFGGKVLSFSVKSDDHEYSKKFKATKKEYCGAVYTFLKARKESIDMLETHIGSIRVNGLTYFAQTMDLIKDHLKVRSSEYALPEGEPLTSIAKESRYKTMMLLQSWPAIIEFIQRLVEADPDRQLHKDIPVENSTYGLWYEETLHFLHRSFRPEVPFHSVRFRPKASGHYAHHGSWRRR